MKKFFVYLLILLFSLYALIMFEEGYFYAVFIIGVCFGLILLVESIYIKNHFSANINSTVIPVSQNHEIPVEVKVTNASILPVKNAKLHLKCTNELTGEAINKTCLCNINERQTNCVAVGFDNSTCGVIKIELNKVKISDFLGVFPLTLKVNNAHEIDVLPKLHPIAFPYGAPATYSSFNSDIYDDEHAGSIPPELYGIREYIPGDRLQRIHWKISAKKNHLLVKEFSLPIGFMIALYPDFSTETKSKNYNIKKSLLLEFYVSLSFALLENKFYHYLIWHDEAKTLIRQEITTDKDIYMTIPRLLRMNTNNYAGDIVEEYRAMYLYDNSFTFMSLNTDLELHLNNDLIATIDSGDSGE